MNARIDSSGTIVREGNQVEIGDNDRYISLCRKHFWLGQTKPEQLKKAA
jgi:thymidine kinase